MKTLIILTMLLTMTTAAFAGGSIYTLTPEGKVHSWTITDYPLTGNQVITDNQTLQQYHISNPDRLLGGERMLGVQPHARDPYALKTPLDLINED